MKYSSWDEAHERELSPGAAAAKERQRKWAEDGSRGNAVERTSSERPLTRPVIDGASSNEPSGIASPGGLVAGCVHQYKCVRGRFGDAGGCERPRRLVCVLCAAWFGRRCESGSAAKCVSCSRIKAGDIAAIGRSGWSDRPVDRAFLLTLTAPGVEVLPWDESRCRHGDGVACSGKIGCRVESMSLAAWHASLPRRWSDFITYLRRELGVDVQFMKTYESQDREALHVHAMVRINGVCTDRRLRAAVRLCVARWDFGRKFDISYADVHEGEVVGDSAPRVAHYAAKYVAKSCDALESVPMLCGDGVVRCRRVRTWSASRRWGMTMKDCKLRRSAFMRAGGGGGTPQAGTPPAPQAPLTSKGIIPQSDSAEPGLTPIGSSIAG